MSRTIEQRRAAHALNAVQILPDDEEVRKCYRSYAENLGPAILMNGLGQALATELAAGGDDASEDKNARVRAHYLLYKNIESWLLGSDGVYVADSNGKDKLLQAIINNDQQHYMRAQTEALAWLIWHKKFCRAYLPSGRGDE
jgi:CRISPR-associated protein Cmr5